MTQETKASKKTNSNFLDPEEEVRIFREYQSLMRTFQETGSKKVFKAMQGIRTRVTDAFEPLIRANAKSLSGYSSVPHDQLISEGMVALLEAIDKFDLSKGLKFATLADKLIRYKMYNFISSNFSIVNVCKSTIDKRLFFSLRKEITRVAKEEGRFVMTEDFAKEMAEKFNCQPSHVFAMNAVLMSGDFSTATQVGGDDENGGSEYEDFIISHDDPIDEDVINGEQVVLHRSLIDTCIERYLTPRESDIYRRRVLSETPQTLEVVAKGYNLSRERIRQLESRAQTKIEKGLPILMQEQRINAKDLF